MRPRRWSFGQLLRVGRRRCPRGPPGNLPDGGRPAEAVNHPALDWMRGRFTSAVVALCLRRSFEVPKSPEDWCVGAFDFFHRVGRARPSRKRHERLASTVADGSAGGLPEHLLGPTFRIQAAKAWRDTAQLLRDADWVAHHSLVVDQHSVCTTSIDLCQRPCGALELPPLPDCEAHVSKRPICKLGFRRHATPRSPLPCHQRICPKRQDCMVMLMNGIAKLPARVARRAGQDHDCDGRRVDALRHEVVHQMRRPYEVEPGCLLDVQPPALQVPHLAVSANDSRKARTVRNGIGCPRLCLSDAVNVVAILADGEVASLAKRTGQTAHVGHVGRAADERVERSRPTLRAAADEYKPEPRVRRLAIEHRAARWLRRQALLPYEERAWLKRRDLLAREGLCSHAEASWRTSSADAHGFS